MPFRRQSTSASYRRSWRATSTSTDLSSTHAYPAFSDEVDVHPDRYLLEAHPTFNAQFCRAKTTGDQGQFHLLYPNTGINVFPGPANLSIGPIVPAGPGRTERC